MFNNIFWINVFLFIQNSILTLYCSDYFRARRPLRARLFYTNIDFICLTMLYKYFIIPTML